MQDQLLIVPGKMWNTKIDSHCFLNLPVYSLGGKSLITLFEKYKILYDLCNQIGRTNFIVVARLLCTKEKMHTGLSSYFIRLCDVAKIISKILKRISLFENIIGLGLNEDEHTEIGNDIEYLLDEWNIVYSFLQHEYSHYHVKVA